MNKVPNDPNVADALANITPEQAQQILDLEAYWDAQEATDIKTLPCPDWCTVDHTDPEKMRNERRMSRLREHSRSFLDVPRPGKKTLHVDVCVCDDLDAGTRPSPAEVWVFGVEDGLSPEDAERLAAALPEAARVARSENVRAFLADVRARLNRRG